MRTLFDAALLDTTLLPGLVRSGQLGEYFPEVQEIVGFGGGRSGHKALWPHTIQVVSQCPPNLRIRWAALFHDVAKPDCIVYHNGDVQFHGHEEKGARLFEKAAQRTHFFNEEEVKHISFLIRHLGMPEEYDEEWTDSAVRRLYKTAGIYFDDLILLARADVTTKHDNKREALRKRMDSLSTRAVELARIDAIPPALVTGLGDVLAAEFGVKGRDLGVLMNQAKAAVEDGKLPRQADPTVVISYLRGVR